TNRRPDQSASSAATLMSTMPSGRAWSRNPFSEMSLTCPPALRGHASQSAPAGKMRRARAGSLSASSASARKNATTTSAGSSPVTVSTASGRPGTCQPSGAATRARRVAGLTPSFVASGVFEYPATAPAYPSPHERAQDPVRGIGDLDGAVHHRELDARILEQVAPTRPGERHSQPDPGRAAGPVRLVEPQHQGVGILRQLDGVEHQ